MIRVVKKKSYSKRKAEDYIFQRKIKFAYSKLKRVFQIIFLILFISFLVWIFNYAGDYKVSNAIYNYSTEILISLGLRIKSVEIIGNKIVPTDIITKKVLESLGNVYKKSLILLDLEKLKSDIMSIGWIESVEIRKKMPGTLIVRVTERTPKFIWQNQGKIWLADEDGNLLSQKIEKKYVYLPLIIGQDPKKDVPELFKIINSSAKLSSQIYGASKIGNRRWDITLNNRIKVRLPEENPDIAWKKLEELESKDALFSKKINYIDMRIEGQVVTGLSQQEKKNEVLEIRQKHGLQKN